MRSTWTDSRLDDLKDQVTVIDSKVDRLDAKVDKLGERMNERLDSGFGRLDARIDKLNHTVLHVLVGLAGTIVALVIALIGIFAAHS